MKVTIEITCPDSMVDLDSNLHSIFNSLQPLSTSTINSADFKQFKHCDDNVHGKYTIIVSKGWK